MKKSYFISFLSLEAEEADDDDNDNNDGGSFKDVEAIAEVRATSDFGGLVDGAAAEDTFAADFVIDLIGRCSMGMV